MKLVSTQTRRHLQREKGSILVICMVIAGVGTLSAAG